MEESPLPLLGAVRACERAREILLVSYTFDAEHAPEFTETSDIAIGGMAMITNAALAPDLAIIIELELRGNDTPTLRLNGNVRWSTYDPLLDKYRTGVAFTDAPADFERELQNYIDTLQSMRELGAL